MTKAFALKRRQDKVENFQVHPFLLEICKLFSCVWKRNRGSCLTEYDQTQLKWGVCVAAASKEKKTLLMRLSQSVSKGNSRIGDALEANDR